VFPLIVPRRMWDRANAVDSGGWVVATVVGPGLAGAMVAVVGAVYALLVPAAALIAGAALLVGVSVPRSPTPTAPLLRDAWAGLAYVVRNADLRMLAICVSILNLGFGMVSVALPVLVLRRLHGGSTLTGGLFAVLGGAGVVSGLIGGRFDTEGRERRLLTLGALAFVPPILVMGVTHSTIVVAAGMAVLGLANGPLDLGLFSLRQRATDPAWFGRAFAVSMSLNYLGIPIGAAIGGPVVDHSITVAFVLAAAFSLVSAAIPFGEARLRRRRGPTGDRGGRTRPAGPPRPRP
jgi:predicted MFS family arabinose efflux permease